MQKIANVVVRQSAVGGIVVPLTCAVDLSKMF